LTLPESIRALDSGDMNETSSILLAYDGSGDAAEAMIWAAATAVREHRGVHALLIQDTDAITSVALPSADPDWQRMKHDVEVCLKEAGVDSAVVETRRARVVPTLLKESAKASMVVLGSRGHGVLMDALVGSVSQEVARKAACPVVVVRPAEELESGRIVVGVDGSPDSKAALEFACRRAELTGEVVAAVYGWRVGDLPVDTHGNVPETVGPMIDDHELLLAESVAGVRAAHPDVVLLRELVPVSPGQALVDASRNASLVVVGSRGHGALTGLVLGSVSNHVLHKAHCPVAVVR